MPTRQEITYWGAGPALLPTDVLEKAAQALLDYEGTGLGIAEHSHRSEIATSIINAAKADLATYLDIPTDEYDILFLQAGGTGEFSAVVYNLVGAWVTRRRAAAIQMLGIADDKAADDNEALVAGLRTAVDTSLSVDYIVTGGWSEKAYKEAGRLLGPEKVNLVTDSRKAAGGTGKFGTIPDESTWNLSKAPAFVYFCDNETVDGVEFPAFPEVLKAKDGQEGPIVVADMSSNILSRPVPVRNYSALFFGAQKNLGSTGVTVAIVKKSLLAPQPSPALLRKLGLPIGPIILSWETIAKNNSLYNTLSIFE